MPIICALLGAPREDWHLFSHWADDISKAFGVNVAEDAPAILRAWEQLDAYVEDLIAARRHSLTDDLISELIRAEDDGDRLTHDELVNLVAILLNAGTDTTRNQLAAAVQVLSDHPDQWALLGDHPELAPQAVEELMRHTPIVFTSLRTSHRGRRTRRCASSRRARSSSPTRRQPTATRRSTTIPTASTSPATARRPS